MVSDLTILLGTNCLWEQSAWWESQALSLTATKYPNDNQQDRNSLKKQAKANYRFLDLMTWLSSFDDFG